MSETLLAFLARQQLFVDVPVRHLPRVLSLATPVEIPIGRQFLHEGQIGREALLIISGCALVTIAGRPIAMVSDGEIVGEIALRGPCRTRIASVHALTHVSGLAFDLREFTALLNRFPSVARRVDDTIARRIARSRPADGPYAEPHRDDPDGPEPVVAMRVNPRARK